MPKRVEVVHDLELPIHGVKRIRASVSFNPKRGNEGRTTYSCQCLYSHGTVMSFGGKRSITCIVNGDQEEGYTPPVLIEKSCLFILESADMPGIYIFETIYFSSFNFGSVSGGFILGT